MGFVEAAKEFLKPTMGKVILFVLLNIIGGQFGFIVFAKQYGIGVPFTAYYNDCGFSIIKQCKAYFDLPALAGDLAFWYIAACVLVYAYERMVKK